MRVRGLFVLGLCLLLMWPGAASCETEKVSQAAVPEWVTPLEVERDAGEKDHHSLDGMYYVLHEMQKNWDTDEQYLRNIILLQNDSGVQNAGKLMATFNPAHQELMVHKVGVLRAGQYIDKLNISKFQIIQPEAELQSDIFSGLKQAVLFIADLRVGDILEYSYTIRGRNPVLGDHHMAAFYTQWGIPINRQYVRVLCPADDLPKIRNTKTDLVPVESVKDGLKEYVWDNRQPEPIPYEDMIPIGFDMYPYVELSNSDGWKEVVDWAVPLYQPEAKELPAELQHQITQWKLGGGSEEKRILEVIRFVQDEIRYTGIQLGAQAYQPAHPFETFRLRYGDCKGKSVLLCVILKELGIEAYPALVDSESRKHVADRLPSPFCFDHVIVKILYAGRPIWIDTTRALQGGGLQSIYVPNFGKALVVKAGVSELEDLPDMDAQATITAYTTITIPDYKSAIALDIKTVSTGANADQLRSQIAGNGTTDLDKNYLNFTALFYPGASLTESIKTEDDRTRNIVTMYESYSVDSFWERDEEEGCMFGVIAADLLDSYLPNPEIRARTMPIGLGHPAHRKQEVTIHLPNDEWEIPEESETIEGPGFKLTYDQKLTGQRLVYTYTCSTTSREIPAADIPLFFEKREVFQDAITRVLFNYDEIGPGGDINWMMVVIALFGVGGTVGICLRIWKIKPRKRRRKNVSRDWTPERGKPGIGGFLIFVSLGLCIAPLIRIVSVFELSGAFSLQAWQLLTVPGSEQYQPLYAPLIIVEVLGNILLIGLDILLLALFFRKRSPFPLTFIAARAFGVVFLWGDTWLAGMMFGGMEYDPQIVSGTFWTIIFSIYMLRSKRVKSTFTR